MPYIRFISVNHIIYNFITIIQRKVKQASAIITFSNKCSKYR
jgi:hypothetical protein